jgi:ribosomal protein L39E
MELSDVQIKRKTKGDYIIGAWVVGHTTRRVQDHCQRRKE